MNTVVSRLLCVLLMAVCAGCVSMRERVYTADSLALAEGDHIHTVVLKNGQMIQFDRDGGRYIAAVPGPADTAAYRAIVGVTREGAVAEVATRDILEVQVRSREADGAATVVAGSLVVVLGGMLLFLIALSNM